MILEQWFPSRIGFAFNPDHKEMEEELTNYCLQKREMDTNLDQTNWVGKVYNKTIVGVSKFDRINAWVEKQVDLYIQQHGMLNVSATDCHKTGWFNVYDKGDFQEYHYHPSFISCIYFLNSNSNDSKVIFKSPIDDVLDITYMDTTYSPSGTITYDSDPGKLLIFRSHLNHCVEQKQTDDLRITLAYNFNYKFF